MRTWRHVSLPGHSMYTHIRIWAEAINLVVPKARARGWCLHGTTSRRLIQSSYESERAPRLATCKMLFVFLSLSFSRDTGSKVTKHTHTHTNVTTMGIVPRETVRGGHRNRRVACKKSNDPWIFSRVLDEFSNCLVKFFRPTTPYFKYQQPLWFKVVTLTTSHHLLFHLGNRLREEGWSWRFWFFYSNCSKPAKKE